MQLLDGRTVYSASDLNDYLECPHLTSLTRAVAQGALARPEQPAEETQRSLLARKGDAHERHYFDALRASGADVADLSPERDEPLPTGCRRTLEAIERGHRYIYQPTFYDGTFMGRADFLRRVEQPNPVRGWSYEPIDTKLARTAKPYFLVQLASYAQHLAALQGGMLPRHVHVALGSGEERTFATGDFMAYFRHLRASFLSRAGAPETSYPLPCAHCAVCIWAARCDRQRRADDHLCLVAGMRRDQAERLHAAGIETLAALAQSDATDRPLGFNPQTFANLQLQASLQRAQRDARAAGLPPEAWYRYQLLPFRERTGFALLPQPDPGDVYFDIEGDPLYAPEVGLEYLFGIYLPSERSYRAFWARSAADERGALCDLIDFLLARRAQYPNMHVYHYANYEKAALGRLTTRYATRRDELDDLLRAHVFVDSYTVVRQALRISQESYSIKRLEPFYGFERTTDLRRGDDSILLFETWLDSHDDTILEEIERYNDDDCRSTYGLHRWLIERRRELAQRDGIDIAWAIPEQSDPAKPEELERRAEIRTLRDEIVGDVAPPDLAALAQLGESERLRWLLGNCIDYHYSEAKPEWWRYHYRRENLDELREFDREALGDIVPDDTVAPYRMKNSSVHAFTFPEQQHAFREGSSATEPHSRKTVTVVRIDDAARTLHVKSTDETLLAGLRALIPVPPLQTSPMQNALLALGREYRCGMLESARPAIVDVLLARAPRSVDRAPGATLQPAIVDGTTLAERIEALDGSYLLVQGPPGSGKSTIAGEAIALLLQRGLRIGVLARSHKVAHNLLDAIVAAATERGIAFAGAHKYSTSQEGTRYVPEGSSPFITDEKSNDGALDTRYQLVSGTAWLFSSSPADTAFDALVVDEAGQLALADAIACARSARNLVLLGDPMQLGAIEQGSHPPGLGCSILEHLLAGRATVPPERGIFLPQSWRMPPALCRFISETVYEGRLDAAAGNEVNAIASPGLCGGGLRAIAVEHDGNARSSPQEAQVIASEVARLRRGSATVNRRGTRPILESDILVVTPYNAQRETISRALAAAGFPNVRVGTVDKFQGQQAPVVFYSMATSSGEELPRDLEFLFEKNRFNVAISRAQCLSVLVYSPRLLDVRTRTPEQMALVNVLCAYVEAAAQAGGATTIVAEPEAV